MYAIFLYAIILIALVLWVYFDAISNEENKKGGVGIDSSGSTWNSNNNDSSEFDTSFSGDIGGGD